MWPGLRWLHRYDCEVFPLATMNRGVRISDRDGVAYVLRAEISSGPIFIFPVWPPEYPHVRWLCVGMDHVVGSQDEAVFSPTTGASCSGLFFVHALFDIDGADAIHDPNGIRPQAAPAGFLSRVLHI